jgi:hypothetical protein
MAQYAVERILDFPATFISTMSGHGVTHVEFYIPRRLRGTLLLCSLALLGTVACVPPKPLIITAPPAIEAARPDKRDTPRPAIRFYSTFWQALGDVNVQAAWIDAGSLEQRSLADGVEAFLGGQDSQADSIICTLLGASDPEVRRAARITYGALLTSQGHWSRLAAFADSANAVDSTNVLLRDAAGVESWAPSFRDVSTSISFGDTIASVPLSRSVTGIAVIPVVINGVTRHFWLDTGTSITIITSSE